MENVTAEQFKKIRTSLKCHVGKHYAKQLGGVVCDQEQVIVLMMSNKAVQALEESRTAMELCLCMLSLPKAFTVKRAEVAVAENSPTPEAIEREGLIRGKDLIWRKRFPTMVDYLAACDVLTCDAQSGLGRDDKVTAAKRFSADYVMAYGGANSPSNPEKFMMAGVTGGGRGDMSEAKEMAIARCSHILHEMNRQQYDVMCSVVIEGLSVAEIGQGLQYRTDLVDRVLNDALLALVLSYKSFKNKKEM